MSSAVGGYISGMKAAEGNGGAKASTKICEICGNKTGEPPGEPTGTNK